MARCVCEVGEQTLKTLLFTRSPGEDTESNSLKRINFTVFLKIYSYIYFLERRVEKERDKHHCVVASLVPPSGDLAHNPGMCPDWESNW